MFGLGTCQSSSVKDMVWFQQIALIKVLDSSVTSCLIDRVRSLIYSHVNYRCPDHPTADPTAIPHPVPHRYNFLSNLQWSYFFLTLPAKKGRTMATFIEKNWQTTRATIRERTRFMFNNDLISDVKFIVRGSDGSEKELPAHKFVLSISSPVFYAMFYGPMADTSNTIALSDCDYEGLSELFRFMYSDEVYLTRSCVMQVLYLADKYILPSLVRECLEYIREIVDESNALCILGHASRYSEQNEDLVERCWELIDDHTEQVIQSDEFVTIDKSILEALVDRDSLNIQEINLFKAVTKWAEYQCELKGLVADGCVKRDIIGEKIVTKIRFPVMEKSEFASVVLDSNILLPHEAFDLTRYMYHCLASLSPRGFLSTKRIGGLKHCQVFASVINFGWAHHEELKRTVYLRVDKAIKMHGIRLFGSDGEQQNVTLEVLNSSGKVVYAHKKGTFASVQFQFKSTSFYGIDVLLEQPADLVQEIVYCLRVSFSGSVSWHGGNMLKSVQSSGVMFRFSANEKMKDLPKGASQKECPKILPEILFTLK